MATEPDKQVRCGGSGTDEKALRIGLEWLRDEAHRYLADCKGEQDKEGREVRHWKLRRSQVKITVGIAYKTFVDGSSLYDGEEIEVVPASKLAEVEGELERERRTSVAADLDAVDAREELSEARELQGPAEARMQEAQLRQLAVQEREQRLRAALSGLEDAVARAWPIICDGTPGEVAPVREAQNKARAALQFPDQEEETVETEKWTIHVCPHRNCPGAGEAYDDSGACHFIGYHVDPAPLESIEVVPASTIQHLEERVGETEAEIKRLLDREEAAYHDCGEFGDLAGARVHGAAVTAYRASLAALSNQEEK